MAINFHCTNCLWLPWHFLLTIPIVPVVPATSQQVQWGQDLDPTWLVLGWHLSTNREHPPLVESPAVPCNNLSMLKRTRRGILILLPIFDGLEILFWRIDHRWNVVRQVIFGGGDEVLVGTVR